MLKIWKYPISMEDSQTIQIPVDAEILSVKLQHNKPVMWVKLDTEASKVVRHFTLYATDEILPPRIGKYIDTFQMHNDNLVFHVFEDA